MRVTDTTTQESTTRDDKITELDLEAKVLHVYSVLGLSSPTVRCFTSFSSVNTTFVTTWFLRSVNAGHHNVIFTLTVFAALNNTNEMLAKQHEDEKEQIFCCREKGTSIFSAERPSASVS